MIQEMRTDYLSTANPPPHTVVVNSERPEGPDRYCTHDGPNRYSTRVGEPVNPDRRDIKSIMMDIIQVTDNLEGLAHRVRENVCGGRAVEPPQRPDSKDPVGLIDGLEFLLRRLEHVGGLLGETDLRLGS